MKTIHQVLSNQHVTGMLYMHDVHKTKSIFSYSPPRSDHLYSRIGFGTYHVF